MPFLRALSFLVFATGKQPHEGCVQAGLHLRAPHIFPVFSELVLMLPRTISRSVKGKGRATVAVSPASLQTGITPSRRADWRSESSRHASTSVDPLSNSAVTCTCRSLAQTRFIAQSRPASRAHFHSTIIRPEEGTLQIADLPVREYHELADATMDSLTDRLEQLSEEIDDDEMDVEYSSGVLTVKLPAGKGTYVINKQPPNKQIWLSSPLSGPKRYDYSKEKDAWFYHRDGSLLLDLLETELSDKMGQPVKFGANR